MKHQFMNLTATKIIYIISDFKLVTPISGSESVAQEYNADDFVRAPGEKDKAAKTIENDKVDISNDVISL